MRLLSLLLCVAGCLPAYDNMFKLTTTDGGGMDGGAEKGSGLFVTGFVGSIEDVKYGQGAVLHIDGFPQPEFTSMPADAAGKFKLEIPQSLVDSKEPRYLNIEGTYNGKAILKTWDAPKRVFDGTTQDQNIGVHFLKNQDDMMGVRQAIADALAAHGDIPSAASFATDYSFMLGYLYELFAGSERDFRGYTIQITADGSVLDNTACNPSMQCCVYYAYDFAAFKAASPPMPSIIDFSATSSPIAFVVVCPGSQSGDITLTQTAPLNQVFNQMSGKNPTKQFSPIEAPRVVGDGAIVYWTP